MELTNKTYTIDDIYKLSAGERAELIDEHLYPINPPNQKYQEVLNYLSAEIKLYIESKNLDCEIYIAPFPVILKADGKTYVEPDISVICDKSKLTNKGYNGAPDWIIEIASPDSRILDYYIKFGEYCTAGVKEYWIVDLEGRVILVYNITDREPPVVYKFTDKITSKVIKDLEIDCSIIS